MGFEIRKIDYALSMEGFFNKLGMGALSVGFFVVYLTHRCGLNSMCKISFGLLAGAITFAASQLFFEEKYLPGTKEEKLLVFDMVVFVVCLCSGVILECGRCCRNEYLKKMEERKIIEEEGRLKKKLLEKERLEKIERDKICEQKKQELKQLLKREYDLKLSRVKDLVGKINSEEGNDETWEKLVLQIKSLKQNKCYDEEDIISLFKKIENINILKILILKLIDNGVFSYKSQLYFPRLKGDEQFVEKMTMACVDNFLSNEEGFRQDVLGKKNSSPSHIFQMYMHSSFAQFNLIETEKTFVNVVNKIITSFLQYIDEIYNLKTKQNRGEIYNLKTKQKSLYDSDECGAIGFLMRKRQKYLDNDNEIDFNSNEHGVLKLVYYKKRPYIVIVGKENGCKALNYAVNVTYIMNAYKFLLKRMLSNGEALNELEFEKHKSFLNYSLKRVSNYFKVYILRYPKNLLIVPFIKAIGDYFDPVKKLVNSKMTKEIAAIIDENIKNLIDFKSLDNSQKLKLYDAFEKIGAQKEFCDSVLIEEQEREKRLDFIQSNLNFVYLQKDLIGKIFEIRMQSCLKVKVNKLFLNL